MERNVSTEEMMYIIKCYWDKHPELRLGQLLVGITKKNDIFYVEDDDICKLLVEKLNKEDPDWNKY